MVIAGTAATRRRNVSPELHELGHPIRRAIPPNIIITYYNIPTLARDNKAIFVTLERAK